MTVAVRSVVTDYAERVLGGEIVAGKPVRQACQRHMQDLARADADPTWGYHFDEAAAAYAIDFFPEVLELTEGEFAGKPFVLQPFQQFIVGSLFGWKGADSYRRFRTAYIEMGKGDGKSPMAGGVGLFGLTMDGEAGAEVYAAAVTRDQAKILFSDAEKMGQKSLLAPELEFTVNNIAHPASQSFFRAISAEARALDGKRVHMALIDEVHEHPNAMVVDKMRAGTKNRRQALIFEITNSGYDRNSVCYQHHQYSLQILDGILVDDSWFGYVAQLDSCSEHATLSLGCPDCDDWTDEAVWPKANPGLDTILPRKYLREQVNEAQGMPSKLNIVLRLNFCVWTEQANRWLPMEKWDACNAPVDPYKLRGRQCWMGLDLAATKDLSALALLFEPDADDVIDVLMHFWVPAEDMRKRSSRDRVPYDVWVRDGFISVTEGEVTDFGVIRRDINELGKTYTVREIAYDRWGMPHMRTQLEDDGFVLCDMGQGFASLTAPSKELERRVIERTIRHGGNPVLRWNASNVAIRTDPAGNIKPDKDASTERIDGIAALINAMSRMMVEGGEAPSRYARGEGLRVLG